MAAKRGDQMLLKHGNQGSPETFTAVAGLRTGSLTWNSEQVDITSADDASKWRQLMEGVGIMSLAASGSGVFKDDAISLTIRSRAMSGQHLDNWQIVVPGLGTFSGPFQVTSIKYDGTYKGEETYDISLESAGDITFA